jgi:hypothetical protein
LRFAPPLGPATVESCAEAALHHMSPGSLPPALFFGAHPRQLSHAHESIIPPPCPCFYQVRRCFTARESHQTTPEIDSERCASSSCQPGWRFWQDCKRADQAIVLLLLAEVAQQSSEASSVCVGRCFHDEEFIGQRADSLTEQGRRLGEVVLRWHSMLVQKTR